MRKGFVIGVPLLVLLPIALLLALSATPVVNLASPVTNLGQATPITVSISDPHGIRKLTAFVEQNGVRYRVGETAQPMRLDGTWNFTAGTSNAPQLKDGKAQLIVGATSNDFLRNAPARCALFRVGAAITRWRNHSHLMVLKVSG